MSHLRLVNLSKRFGEIAALDGVSFDLAAGELLVVCGPSGSGKSTLLRLLAGLETASSGEIRWGDERFDELPPERREVALIGQNPALLPQLNVAENMGLGLRLRKVPVAEAKARIDTSADRLGLTGLLKRMPHELSGGEQQRVALGRVLVSRPRLLLLDEPLSQLDPELRRSLRSEIRRLQRELDVPAIHVTHDQEEAMELADRLAVMKAGRLEQIGRPEEVFQKPANPFVAEFLSPAGINRIEGRIERDSSGPWFLAEGLRRRIPERFAPSGADGRRLLLLRPEAIWILRSPSLAGCDNQSGATDRGEAGQGAIEDGTVTRVIHLGWERRIELASGGRTWLARSIEDSPMAEGDAVRWSVDWSRALWFDADH